MEKKMVNQKGYDWFAIPAADGAMIRAFCKAMGVSPAKWIADIGRRLASGEFTIVPTIKPTK